MWRTQRTLNTAGVLVHSVRVWLCVCVLWCVVCLCVENERLRHVNIQFQGSEVSCHVEEHPLMLQRNMFLSFFNLRRLIVLIFDNMNVIYKYTM
jgi:hypothetical protein